MVESKPRKLDQGEIPKSRGRSTQVSGLGMIAALIAACWSLVTDRTPRLSEFLLFVALLLFSAGGLVWQMLKPAPNRGAESRG